MRMHKSLYPLYPCYVILIFMQIRIPTASFIPTHHSFSSSFEPFIITRPIFKSKTPTTRKYGNMHEVMIGVWLCDSATASSCYYGLIWKCKFTQFTFYICLCKIFSTSIYTYMTWEVVKYINRWMIIRWLDGWMVDRLTEFMMNEVILPIMVMSEMLGSIKTNCARMMMMLKV